MSTTHVHEWKDAPDWDAGPALKAQECFGCRGLRFLKVLPRAADLRGIAKGMTGGISGAEYVRLIRDEAGE